MRKRDLVANAFLFDMLFRHQVYLEGLKLSIASYFSLTLRKLYDEFSRFIVQSPHSAMDEFTRAQLLAFVSRFSQAQVQAYNAYTQELIDILKRFLGEDKKIAEAIFAEVLAAPTTADANQTFEGLWEVATSEPIPANGQYLLSYIAAFGAYFNASVTSLLRQGYANNWSMAETFAALVGTASGNFRDGLFGRLLGQNQSLVNTAVQHISATAQAEIASKSFTRYQWVSILDNRTTEICRERNGHIYEYGKGPLPPARYNCRSKIVPIVDGEQAIEVPKTYQGWFNIQPDVFRNDVGSGNIKPLTLLQFAGKLKTILAI